MLDLIAKLEAAMEGSSDLDHAIAHTVGNARSVEVEGMADIVYEPAYPGGQPRCRPLRYTTSLDAALTLVPPKCAIQMFTPPLYGARQNEANVYPPGKAWHKDRSLISIGHARSLALALCIAALRARHV